MPTPRQRVTARAIARARGPGSTHQRKDQLTSQTIRGCGCRGPRSRVDLDDPLRFPGADIRMACPLHDEIQRSFPPRTFRSAVWNGRNSLDEAPEVGGARRNRTDDLLLAKQALSQLSYGPRAEWRMGSSEQASARPTVHHSPSLFAFWWAWEDLNFRPHAYQARALTS